MGQRRVLNVPIEDKFNFIFKHEEHFHIADLHYQYMSDAKLSKPMKRLAILIRTRFNYSYKTGDFDLVSSWLRTYRDYLTINKLRKPMAKTFDHKTLEKRIRDVFENEAHKEHHDMLMEIFPEIYEQVKADSWNDNYTVGNVYVRLTANDLVTSLLMPVVVNTFPESEEVKMLNLITGKFWDTSVKIHRNKHGKLSFEDWDELTGRLHQRNLFNIGKFDHNARYAEIVGQHTAIAIHETLVGS